MLHRILVIWLFLCQVLIAFSQMQWQYTGQWSALAQYQRNNVDQYRAGSRYLPALNSQLPFSTNHSLDFETSLNMWSLLSGSTSSDIHLNGKVEPYRLWIRYSGNQYEIRAGLQKINFGSATLLRPLMWFDQTDARDPLQLTHGVWGILGRTYFLNNANLWIWALMGNSERKTWDITPSRPDFPEMGGRLQHPIPKGELALTYHFRKTDAPPPTNKYDEHRYAIDGKWDIGPGLWVEGVAIDPTTTTVSFVHQKIMTLGADYTFGIGNGLYTMFEHLQYLAGSHYFSTSQHMAFSALSLSYPIGIGGNINYIVYQNTTNNDWYHFLNFRQSFQSLVCHVMLFMNPANSALPLQASNGNLYTGNGIMLMLVYHH